MLHKIISHASFHKFKIVLYLSFKNDEMLNSKPNKLFY